MTNPTTPPLPSGDDLSVRLGERYAVKPVPPCRVCGAPLSLSAAGGGSLPKYNCSSLGMDFGVKTNQHYYASEHFHDHGDPDVISLLAERAALNARVEEARALLEPFATLAEDCVAAAASYPDDDPRHDISAWAKAVPWEDLERAMAWARKAR